MKLASAPAARGLYAGDRLVHAGDRQGIGPGDDEEIPAGPGFDRGANLLHVLLAIDHALAAHVPALLGPHLVFEKAAGRPGGNQFVHRAEDVERIAVTGVGVDDDGNPHAHANASRPLDHFRLRQQAHVGLAQGRGGDRIAGDEGHGKADVLGELRRQGVKHSGEGDRAGLVQRLVHSGRVHGLRLRTLV